MKKLNGRLLGAVCFIVLIGALVLARPLDAEAQFSAPTPFQIKLDACFDSSDTLSSGTSPGGSVTVPSGKRWFIQHVSAVGRVPSGEKLILLVAIFSGGAFVFEHAVPVEIVGSFPPDGDLFSGGQEVSMYAISGETVQFSARRSGTGTTPIACITVFISGLLI